jgi:hypothetical protein
MRSAAVTFAVVVALIFLVAVASPFGVKRTHLTCDGVVTYKYPVETTRHPNARLGITIEELNPLLFWADERRTFSYSYAYITDDGRVERVMDNSIPFAGFNDVFLSASKSEGDGSSLALFYDNISGLVQLVLIGDETKRVFDGFCKVGKQAV